MKWVIGKVAHPLHQLLPLLPRPLPPVVALVEAATEVMESVLTEHAVQG